MRKVIVQVHNSRAIFRVEGRRDSRGHFLPTVYAVRGSEREFATQSEALQFSHNAPRPVR